jgi:hypothetical protein
MRIPFKWGKTPPAAPALDPVLAAEQRRRVVQWGLTDSEVQPPGGGEDDPAEHDLLPATAYDGADEE